MLRIGDIFNQRSLSGDRIIVADFTGSYSEILYSKGLSHEFYLLAEFY